MKTVEELASIRTATEPASIAAIEVIKTPNGSMVSSSEVAVKGIDTVLEGYRISVRSGAMTAEAAASSYRRWNPDSLYIPEDF